MRPNNKNKNKNKNKFNKFNKNNKNKNKNKNKTTTLPAIIMRNKNAIADKYTDGITITPTKITIGQYHNEVYPTYTKYTEHHQISQSNKYITFLGDQKQYELPLPNSKTVILTIIIKYAVNSDAQLTIELHHLQNQKQYTITTNPKIIKLTNTNQSSLRLSTINSSLTIIQLVLYQVNKRVESNNNKIIFDEQLLHSFSSRQEEEEEEDEEEEEEEEEDESEDSTNTNNDNNIINNNSNKINNNKNDDKNDKDNNKILVNHDCQDESSSLKSGSNCSAHQKVVTQLQLPLSEVKQLKLEQLSVKNNNTIILAYNNKKQEVILYYYYQHTRKIIIPAKYKIIQVNDVHRLDVLNPSLTKVESIQDTTINHFKATITLI